MQQTVYIVQQNFVVYRIIASAVSNISVLRLFFEAINSEGSLGVYTVDSNIHKISVWVCLFP